MPDVQQSTLDRPVRRVFAKSIAKRQRVLDAAAKILARRGYADATITEIAHEVGTHAGSIYYYFPSREDLVREVLLTSIDRMLATLAEPLGRTDALPLERLKAAVRAAMLLYTSASDDYSKAYMRSFNQVPDALAREFNARRQATRETWLRLLRDAKDAGELRPTVNVDLASLMIMGASSWVSTWFDPTGALSGEQISDAFVAMLLGGLAPPAR